MTYVCDLFDWFGLGLFRMFVLLVCICGLFVFGVAFAGVCLFSLYCLMLASLCGVCRWFDNLLLRLDTFACLC